MITYAKFDFNSFQREDVFVTDKNVFSLYNFPKSNTYVLPEIGEKAKSFAVVQSLCEFLLYRNFNRGGRIIAVGGGTVCDTVGFVASIYKRGINLTLVPTTLIAMCDAGLGGKTAINVAEVKNAVGTFYKSDTMIDFSFLSTLPIEELKNGLGEIVKYSLLDENINNSFAKRESSNDFKTDYLIEVIKLCVEYKQQIIEKDFYDINLRRALNLGHTIGHAMELKYNISHGQAVLNGLYYETLLSFRLGYAQSEYAKAILEYINKFVDILPIDRFVLQLISNDKKNANDKIGFVLLTKPYETTNVNIAIDVVINALC
ncbi:MAG: 3-dehydroquinate synthase family protein [Clostridia bacterium]